MEKENKISKQELEDIKKDIQQKIEKENNSNDMIIDNKTSKIILKD